MNCIRSEDYGGGADHLGANGTALGLLRLACLGATLYGFGDRHRDGSLGRVVPGAEVSSTDIDRDTHSTVKTDITGRYLLRSLSPGNYSLQVSAPGLNPYDFPKIALDVNATVTANAYLQLARRKDQCRGGSGSILLSDDATISQTLTHELINDLPLVDRNPFDLAFLAPGVSQAPGSTYGNGVSTPGFVTNFVSDGSRNAQADMLLDGVSIMNSDNNPGVQKALYVPPVEAIQEFKIQQANFSAEFGNSGGTIVNVVTRSGTNQYHGELFEFFRNNDLNANSFFANAAGLAQPHLTRNDFGVTAGGPIFKNKTFFFFDFNGIRALTGATSSLAGVPDAAERTGNFGELCPRVGGTFNPAVFAPIPRARSTILTPANRMRKTMPLAARPFRSTIWPPTSAREIRTSLSALEIYPQRPAT